MTTAAELPATGIKPLVLAIDDTPQNLALIDELLSDDYRVKVAPNGLRGLKLASGTPAPDLILLDIMMPDIDGFEVCRRLKADPVTQHIPVIFLTAKSDLADEQQGFAVGAVDYITKPISAPILMARVRTQLMLKSMTDFLRDRNAYLEQEVERRTEESRRRTEELRISHEVTMVALASIAETRDNETGYHILRTQHYVRLLAEHLQHQPGFAELLDQDLIEQLFKASPLHDIGKVGIPDRILLKPGRLDADEFEIMKTHTTLGRDAIENAQLRVGVRVPLLETAKEIALSHQEKWDGSGYPEGLSSTAIPLSARLMAVADVYDALISRRVYKEPMPHDQAAAIIIAGRGTHFDPNLVAAFVLLQDQFKDIATRYADSEENIARLEATAQRAMDRKP
jgi:putative two-component system response regulator